MSERRFCACVMSILIGSLFIMAGTEAIRFGPMGIFTGTGKWVGGLLIFLILAVVTSPIALLVRYISGMLPFSPVAVACTIGPIISVLLIPLIQPAMTAQFWEKSILPFVIVHLLAGAAGGYTWYRVEFRSPISKTGS